MKRLFLLLLCATPAFALQDNYISIADVGHPALNATQTFTAEFGDPGDAATGVKPIWTVAGAQSTFIYADSTQKIVHVVIPQTPPAGYVFLCVSATIPETPSINVNECRTVVLAGQ